MKPALEHLPRAGEESFVVREFEYNYYPTPWHFHPEYELVLVTESSGKRFIGDNISNFRPGNLVLLGPNLPHLYKNDARYYISHSGVLAKSIIVHFLENSFGNFLSMPEAKNIKQLLAESVQGIEIKGETNEIVSKKLRELVLLKDFPRCLKLLEILQAIADVKKHQHISNAFVAGINEKESERMNKVLDFLMKNFSTDISRADAAKISNMSENAFSRYFSQRTRKTFASYLNELRLNHAARLLVEKNERVAEICYECGFNNLSNFNRQFKLMYNTNPLIYRKAYWEK